MNRSNSNPQIFLGQIIEKRKKTKTLLFVAILLCVSILPGFSNSSICSIDTLPGLLDFTAKSVLEGSKLKWKGVNLQEGSFRISRSFENDGFEQIHETKAQEELFYEYIDSIPAEKKLSYDEISYLLEFVEGRESEVDIKARASYQPTRVTYLDFTKSSSREYRSIQLAKDTSQQNAVRRVNAEFQRAQRFNIADNENLMTFRLRFINLSGIPAPEFRQLISSHTEVLNQDFGSTPDVGKDSSVYDRIIMTPNFSFSVDLTTSLSENALGSVEWKDWDDFKHAEIGKDIDQVDESAIHIWVIDVPDDIGSYVSLPDGSVLDDGIVVDVDVFGGRKEGFGGGKALTTLMGEYFGLTPLYMGECEDDHVRDTPRHHYPLTSCDSDFIITSQCDQRPMMPGNFMSAAPDECKYMFTAGQVARMRHFISSSKSLTRKTQN